MELMQKCKYGKDILVAKNVTQKIGWLKVTYQASIFDYRKREYSHVKFKFCLSFNQCLKVIFRYMAFKFFSRPCLFLLKHIQPIIYQKGVK